MKALARLLLHAQPVSGMGQGDGLEIIPGRERAPEEEGQPGFVSDCTFDFLVVRCAEGHICLYVTSPERNKTEKMPLEPGRNPLSGAAVP